MSAVVESIRAEYLRYKTLAEQAIQQLSDEQLSTPGPNSSNSIAIICWHVSGNLRSRFTDFLTTDGEKVWRDREQEFQPRTVTRAELLSKWEDGWAALTSALATLTDDGLARVVSIRHERMEVHQALHRSLAHTAYHVGQLIYLAHALRGQDWRYLSIPPGGSAAFNERMQRQSS
jgi:hypothetical protein